MPFSANPPDLFYKDTESYLIKPNLFLMILQDHAKICVFFGMVFIIL
jgi:hypothetical protein